MLAICRYHRNSNGWNDIGYNALVDKYGVLYEGRAGGLDRAVVGAQAQGFNSETAGIASIADHTTLEATPETLDAIARYVALEARRAPPAAHRQRHADERGRTREPLRRRRASVRVAARARSPRHRAAPPARATCCTPSSTSCGRMVATGVGAAPAVTASLSAALADTSIDYGETVPVTGVLRGARRARAAAPPRSTSRPTPTGAG